MSGTNQNIIMGFRPTPNVGTVFDPSVQVTNAQQLLQFKQQQDQVEQQNALMGLFRDPKSLDGTGNPTPETIQKATAIHPEFGLKLRQNMLVNQDREIKQKYFMSEAAATNADRIAEAYEPVVERRAKKIADGMPPSQADLEANAEVKQVNDRLATSGMPPELLKMQPQGWDPVKIPLLVQNTKGFRDWQTGQRKDEEERRKQTHDRNTGAQQLKLDDGTNIVFRPNSDDPAMQYTFAGTNTPVPADKLNKLTKVGTEGGSPAAAKQRDDATIAETEQLQAKGEPVPPEKQKAYDDAVARRKAGYDRAAGTAAAKAAPGSAVAEKTARFNEMKTAQQQAGTYKDDTTVYRALDKQMAEDKQTAISDDAALIAAQVALKTGHPPAWMGRSQASLTKFLDTYAKEAKRQNLSADDIAANIAKFSGEMAEARTLGTSSARIDFAAKELDVALPTALEASERVWRPGFKKLAEVQQAIKGQTSDPDLLEFAQFNQQVMSAYSAAMQRGGASTVHAMERAESLLSTATSQAGYMRQLDTLHKEVQTILYGTQAAKDHLRAEITGSPEITNPPVLTGVPRPGATNQPWKQGAPIPKGAIDDLKKDPGSAAHFDDVFGKGEAEKVLGSAKSETKTTAPSARAMAMPAKAADAIDGQVYETTRGPAKWDSKQQKFMPVGGP